MLQLLFPSLLTKLSTPTFFKFFKTYNNFTYLFTALFSSTCTSHEFATMRNCWDIWHGFQQNAVDTSANDRERFFVPAYGQKEVILSCDNANWVSGHWNSKTMFQMRRKCFSNRLIIHEVIIKVRYSWEKICWSLINRFYVSGHESYRIRQINAK